MSRKANHRKRSKLAHQKKVMNPEEVKRKAELKKINEAIDWWQNHLRRCALVVLPALIEQVRGILFPDPNDLGMQFGYGQGQIRPDPKLGRWEVLYFLVGQARSTQITPDELKVTNLTLQEVRDQELIDEYGSLEEARLVRWLQSLSEWELNRLIAHLELHELREKLSKIRSAIPVSS